MGEINAALGGPVTFTALGKTLELPPPRQIDYAEFERWVEHQQYAALSKRRQFMTEDEYAEDRAALNKQIADFYFSWGAPGCQASIKSVAGQCAFGAILLNRYQPGTTADDVYNIILHDSEGYLHALGQVLMAGGDVDPPKTQKETSS